MSGLTDTSSLPDPLPHSLTPSLTSRTHSLTHHSLTHSHSLQALLAPCGTYVFMCIDGKTPKNPCDRRARLWFFRLLGGLGRRLVGFCCPCLGGGEGSAIAGMATGGAIAGMANGTGVADAGVSYTSVEEVENSSYAVSNVFAAKKYGQRWRKKAALNQRKSPRESNDGPETHGQTNQSRVPAPQESNDGPKTHGQARKQSRVPAPNQMNRTNECKVLSELSLDKEPKSTDLWPRSTDLRLFVQRPRPIGPRSTDLRLFVQRLRPNRGRLSDPTKGEIGS